MGNPCSTCLLKQYNRCVNPNDCIRRLKYNERMAQYMRDRRRKLFNGVDSKEEACKKRRQKEKTVEKPTEDTETIFSELVGDSLANIMDDGTEAAEAAEGAVEGAMEETAEGNDAEEPMEITPEIEALIKKQQQKWDVRKGSPMTRMSSGFSNVSNDMLWGIKAISRQADHSNVDSLRNCYYQYLALCKKMQVKPSNLSAYASMGYSKQAVELILRGKINRDNPEYKELILEVRRDCSVAREMQAVAGEGNVIWSIFSTKCFDHVHENDADPEALAEDNNTMISGDESRSLAEKYKQLYDQKEDRN